MSRGNDVLSTVDPAAGLSTTAAEVLEHVDAAVAAYPEVPIARVRVEVAGIPRTLLLKLEGRSPWRSIKGRTALGLVRSIAPRMASRDVTVVESTSGNLGVALSAICRDLGLPFVAVVDLKQSPVIQAAIEANGARLEVVRTPAAATTHLLDRLDRVRKLVAEIPGAVWPNQYENDANRHVHETWTAPEIDRQVGDEAQAVFVAVSTGGTLAGLAAHFRRARPSTRLVAVDVEGSTVFGGVPGGRVLTGIGASRRSTFLTRAGCDDLVYVREAAAIAACHVLRADTGLAVGGSSGAVVAGALDHLAAHPGLTTAVCVCADLGENYTRTVYDPDWLAPLRLTDDPGLLRSRLRGARFHHAEPDTGQETPS